MRSRSARCVCPRAIKELNAKVLFERLDLQAYCRLREIQFLGGLAKAEMFRYRSKDHKAEIVESCHWFIRTFASALYL